MCRALTAMPAPWLIKIYGSYRSLLYREARRHKLVEGTNSSRPGLRKTEPFLSKTLSSRGDWGMRAFMGHNGLGFLVRWSLSRMQSFSFSSKVQGTLNLNFLTPFGQTHYFSASQFM
jgi:hypothetical protein